jgi:GT2 family glycosyltransferase
VLSRGQCLTGTVPDRDTAPLRASLIHDLRWDQLPPTSPQTRHTVTAVIVAHDGARLLPALVQSLRAQTHAVGRIIGVDTGSRDRSGAVLADLIGQDAVYGMDRATGFGQAVWGALRRAPARRLDDSGQPQVEWVWLLHDDCEPAPETLDRLLRAASRDRSVAVVGPKVLDGSDRRILREAGVSIDRAGRRVTGIDVGEIDQGQHDHKRGVLAVGSAGLLVRRDVWEQLGGFDTHLRMFRDDVDFCWRVHSAGYRVQVVTDAVIYHRELTARKGRRPEGLSARRLDRRNALYVLAVNLPLLPFLTIFAGSVAGTLLRAAYFLLTKQGERALDQLTALGDLFGHPLRLWKARRRRAAGRGQGYSAVRIFIPRGRPLRRLGESLASVMSPQGAAGLHHAAADGDDEDDQFIEPRSIPRRIMANHGVQLVLVLLLVSLIAERRLLGASALGGGVLVPAWGGASALWSEYLAGFHAVGIGSAASAQPYVAVVAGLATVLGGQAWLAVDVLLLGSVPLAGLTAYLATRRLVSSAVARVWIAGAYALLPVAMGAVAAGRLGTTTAFILLPPLAQATARMLTGPPRAARRAAWATGLLTAITAAFVPLVWVIVVGILLVLLAARRWAGRVCLVNAAIVVVAPFLVLFPWSLSLLTRPSGFLLEAGRTRDGLSAATLRPSSLLLLHPGGPGLPPLWVTAGLALALVSLALSRRTGLVAAGWLVAVAGFSAALAVSRSTVVPDGGGNPVSGWPGAAMAIAAVGLLLAAAPAADWLAGGLRSADSASAGGQPAGESPQSARSTSARSTSARSTSARSKSALPKSVSSRSAPPRAVAILALMLAAAGPLAAGGSWVLTGVRGPVATVSSPVLPAFVAASSVGGNKYRTLVLREDGGVLTYYVLRQGDPTLGEPELAEYVPGEQALSRQVAALAAPNGAEGGDPGQVLGEFGIRWVVLPSPIDAALAQRLDGAAGIVSVSSAPAYDLWQVSGLVGRVRVLGADGTVSVVHSDVVGASAAHAPPAGGTLVLAEPAGGWKATLNGHALTAQAKPFDGWAQAFTLPAGGGSLVVTRDNLARDLSLVAELIMFFAVCVLALPGKRADPAAEAALAALPTARRGMRAGASEAAGEPEAQSEEDAVPLSAQRRPGRALSRGRGQRGKRAEAPSRLPGRRVASSPGVAAITESDSMAGSRVGVLDDPGGDDFPGADAATKVGTGPWVTIPSASLGSPGNSSRTDSSGTDNASRSPWGASPRSGADSADSAWGAGNSAWGADNTAWGAGDPARSGDGGQWPPAEPGRRAGRDNSRDDGRDPGSDNGRDPGPDNGRDAGRDNGADWTAVLAERDSGAWPTVSGGRPVGAPLSSEAVDAWRSDSGPRPTVPPGPAVPPGPTAPAGPSELTGSTGSTGPIRPNVPTGSTDPTRPADRSTGGQPWEPLAPPREPREPQGAPREAPEPAATGRHRTAPQLAATRSGEAGADEAKPAERHSHRAPGRHGRPARRIWDRAGKDGKDKDKDE